MPGFDNKHRHIEKNKYKHTRQTQLLNHTQPSAFDSVSIHGALGLQSSTVPLLLVASLLALAKRPATRSDAIGQEKK